MKRAIHPHLTLTETLNQSAEVFSRKATQLYAEEKRPKPVNPGFPAVLRGVSTDRFQPN